MTRGKSVCSEIRLFSKENNLRTDGINEILIPVLPVFVCSKNTENRREQTGTDGISANPKQGMFFHSFDADGEVAHQGCLLELTPAGYGRVQFFEWFWGQPSKVIEVAPDYLSACIFYTSAAAMNAAYEQWETDHD